MQALDGLFAVYCQRRSLERVEEGTTERTRDRTATGKASLDENAPCLQRRPCSATTIDVVGLQLNAGDEEAGLRG